MPRTLGYHLVKSAYGLWLPGDDRGSWSEAWDDQICFHSPHTLNPADPIRHRMAEERMKHPPVRFTPDMQSAITDAIKTCITKSNGGLAVARMAIEETHVHLLLPYTGKDIDATTKWLADQTTKTVHRTTNHTGPYGPGAAGDRSSSMSRYGITSANTSKTTTNAAACPIPSCKAATSGRGDGTICRTMITMQKRQRPLRVRHNQ